MGNLFKLISIFPAWNHPPSTQVFLWLWDGISRTVITGKNSGVAIASPSVGAFALMASAVPFVFVETQFFPLAWAAVSSRYFKLIINTFYAFSCFCSTFVWIALTILWQNCFLCLNVRLNRGWIAVRVSLLVVAPASAETGFVPWSTALQQLHQRLLYCRGGGQETGIHFIWQWTLGVTPVPSLRVAHIHSLGFLMWPIILGISFAAFPFPCIGLSL